jgi:putative glutamine amidotransferase
MKNNNSQKPIIGILPDYKDGEINSYSTKSFYALRTSFVDAIAKSGGLAILITYQHDAIDNYLDLIDGLLITGGYFDIDPKSYGEDFIHPTTKLNLKRSEYESAFVTKALARQTLPILGVCNGMQLLSVLHGGKLIQHIPDEKNKNYLDHEQSHISGFQEYGKAYHKVIVKKESRLKTIIGEDEINTNSSHHQAVASVGPELSIVAHADDGIIEAVEKPLHPFCIGIQWHPELNSSPTDVKIFNAFIAKSKEFLQTKTLLK